MKAIGMIVATTSSLLFLSGCASDGTKPDDMGASEHRAAAERERVEAEQHEEQYDPSAVSHRDPSQAEDVIYGVTDVYWSGDVYNPTKVHKNVAEAHRDLAKAHDAAAVTLESFEEAECKAFPASTRPSCPLLGSVATVDDIEGGVRLRFSEGFDVAPVAAHVRCHFAFARAQGYKGMDGCPLYLKGLRVKKGDGAIDLLIEDDAQLKELRKRAHAHAGVSQ